MRKRRFFTSAGEKRKFYQNMRHFGRTREIGMACLGLVPLLGCLGVLLFIGIAAFCLIDANYAHSIARSGQVHQILAGATLLGLNPNTLIQKKTNLSKENEALLAKAESEDRDLTPEEDGKFKANLAEIKSLSARIDRIVEHRDTERSSQKPIAVPDNRADATDDLETIKAAFVGSGIPGAEVLEKPKFRSMGEQLIAVARFERSRGLNRDPRLVAVGSAEANVLAAVGLMRAGVPQREAMAAAAGLNEAVPAEGGFLVQGDVAEGLLQRTYETGEILQLMPNPIEISSPSNRVTINGIDEQSRANGSRFGGVQAYWSNEAGTLSATKPKFRQIQLVLNKLIALCYATDEMVADAAVMESIINNVFPMEFAFRIEDSLFNGLGSGQPLGFLNSPALVVVAKEGGQAANTVVSANVMKMWSRCWARSRRQGIWCIDQSIEPQLFGMTLPNAGVATPIYLPPGGLSGSPYGTLFGRPVILTEYNAALTNQGDITLWDPSQMAFARKSVLQAASSMHVNFLTDEMAYRFTMRLDAQPAWNTPLIPKNAGPTLSPFVTLAAR